MNPRPWWFWLTALLVPVALVVAAVRLLLTPLFIQVEYRLPYFPPDPYGFTTAQRLHWADQARRYLLGSQGEDWLAGLRFADGSRVFNAREVRHLADVKAVVRSTLRVGLAAAAGLLGLAFWARRQGPRAWGTFRQALAWGGWLTVGFVLLVAGAVLVAFGPFFVFFHRLFFEGDSWLFPTSDTLIRLFPERFWMDAFLAAGLLSGGAGWLLARWARGTDRRGGKGSMI